jgi:cytochrome c oxidase assembly factor 3|uniref:Uncharacterized protein n=1 Tax=Castor canadensis TaxID=51338 RepID=A0A8C0WSR4_CASCN
MLVVGAGDPLHAKNTLFVQGNDPMWEKLTPTQLHFMWQMQLAQWQKTLPQQWTQIIMTILDIGVSYLWLHFLLGVLGVFP